MFRIGTLETKVFKKNNMAFNFTAQIIYYYI